MRVNSCLIPNPYPLSCSLIDFEHACMKFVELMRLKSCLIACYEIKGDLVRIYDVTVELSPTRIFILLAPNTGLMPMTLAHPRFRPPDLPWGNIGECKGMEWVIYPWIGGNLRHCFSQ